MRILVITGEYLTVRIATHREMSPLSDALPADQIKTSDGLLAILAIPSQQG